MKKIKIATLLICIGTMLTLVTKAQNTIDDCQKCLLLTDQSKNRILIVDAASGNMLWEWSAATSNILPKQQSWFNAPSDVKPVYNQKYLLVIASGGGVALVRISDKKAIFYANAGRNPHSVEILPDGNLVSVTSNGNELTIFKMDTLAAPNTGTRVTYFLKDGHNAVWDAKRQCFWATANDTLKCFYYNYQCAAPAFREGEKIAIPTEVAHDLFPVYGEDALWLSTVKKSYKFDIQTKTFQPFPSAIQENIKSISSGPSGYPIAIMVPKEQWWSDEVIDTDGKQLYRQQGLKIYKARWFLDNPFSYPAGQSFKSCSDQVPRFDTEAHRGGAGLMPENTIPAMLNAIDLGVNTLEMDLHITKDGQVVVSHNPILNYKSVTMPNGTYLSEQEAKKYLLYQMTYDSIQMYDVGLKANPEFPLQKKIKAHIPLLADLLQATEAYANKKHQTIHYNIEIKSFAGGDGIAHPPVAEFVRKALAVINKAGIQSRTLIQSFDSRALREVHRQSPEQPLSYLIGQISPPLQGLFKPLGFTPAVLSPIYTIVTPELVTYCHSQQVKVIAWTPDKLSDIIRLDTMEVDGIISNYPDLFADGRLRNE